MKRKLLAISLLLVCAMSACKQTPDVSEWEEAYAEEETVTQDSETGSEEESEEMNTSVLPAKFNLVEEGRARMPELGSDDMYADAYQAVCAMESNIVSQGEGTLDNVRLYAPHLMYYLVSEVEEVAEDAPDGCYMRGAPRTAMLSAPFFPGITVDQLANGVGPISDQIVEDYDLSISGHNELFQELAGIEAAGMMSKYDRDWLLKDANYYSMDDTENIKKILMEKGAMQIPVHVMSRNEYNSVFNKATILTPNGTMVLVGWDDDFPRENFGTYTPEHNGAWLALDMMAGAYGGDGYFWISYEDNSLSQALSFEMVSSATYGEVLSYDQGVSMAYIRNEEEDYTCIANVFQVEEDERLKAVGIYTTGDNQEVEVGIYTDVPDGFPEGGTQIASFEAEIPVNGYHVLELEEELAIPAEKKFSVVVRYKNGEETGYIICEAPGMSGPMGVGKLFIQTYSEENQSYILYQGEWLDMSDEATAEKFGEKGKMNNAAIKAILAK